jgi:uncharacterized membrane protein YgcG
MARTLSAAAQQPRDPKFKFTDLGALQAIAQAAVEVELFTIPLYMTSLYSIEGMHPITGRNSNLYLGRLWPGAKSSACPSGPNEEAFNIVFSVFIQEMLHLQMAANMATVVGIAPDFTSLQDQHYGWTCYGPDLHIIPHIIDLRDTKSNADLTVNVGPLDEPRIRLFLAIEQPEEQAKADIQPDKEKDYFPAAPFADWTRGQPLPLFGTIGWMYQCYYDYLNLEYSDGSSLWEMIWGNIQSRPPVQNDIFNAVSSGHPMREFLGFNTQIATTYPDIALEQMASMMDAITDQGEGAVIERKPQLLQAVLPRYCPDDDALRSDYPSYDDKGALQPSSDAAARFGNDGKDHYERFGEVQEMIRSGAITTWATAGKAGKWQASDLKTADYDQNPNNAKLPSADDIAAAMNRMAEDAAASHTLLSQAAVGAIAGVTTVLNDYWNPPQGQSAPLFPYPSMTGSGDRMAIAWAVLGTCPDLSQGIGQPDPNTLYHACQGLDFEAPGGNNCANVDIFHSCKGSNHCHAQGGCGFVQATTGGGNCSNSGGGGGGGGGGGSCGGGGGCGGGGLQGSTALSLRAFGGLCGGPPVDTNLYSAPSDNKCKGFGGCAVPISDCQLYPKAGKMQVYDFTQDSTGKITSVPIGDIEFAYADKVADVAYKAFSAVIENRKQPVPPQAKANDLRLVFPPST